MKSRPPKKVPASPAAQPLLQRLDHQLEALGWRLLLGLGLLAFLLAAWTFDPKLALSGDNTEFMTLARSLVQGKGLSYISLPDPKPATKYPFGFPLMLAPLEWLAPGNWAAMNWLVVLLFAASIPVIYLLARESLGRLPALLVALWCATLPLLLDYSHQVMSEVPYLFFSLLSLWLIERSLKEEELKGNYWLLGGFAAMMWSYYVRSVGIVLVGALFLYLLLQRRFRQALILGGGAVLVALPWSLRNSAIGDVGSYFRQLISVNPYFPEQGTVDLTGLADRVKVNAQIYSQLFPYTFWPSFDFGSPETAAKSSVSMLYLVLFLLLALLFYAIVIHVKSRQRLLMVTYAISYLGTIMLWPKQWSDTRFLVPIAPVLILFIVWSIQDISGWLQKRGMRHSGTLLGISTALLVCATNFSALGQLAEAGRGAYPPQWQNYYDAGQWLKANAPADAVICCRKDYWLYIVADRACLVYPFKEPEEILAFIEREGIDYVVVEQLGYSSTPRFLVPAIQKYRDRFEIVWQQPNPDTYVLRLLPPKQLPEAAGK
ncbi:MAG: hypothetical protein EXS58_15200 [Candidatus Latescibacteria bacterium]|nr:hypothetical protein [Candidatus Latescibacterota bacterium]